VGFLAAITGTAPLDADLTEVPPTFPAAWLSQPDLKTAVMAALGAGPGQSERALVHLEQTIDTRTPLRLDTHYLLDVGMDGPDDRGLCTIIATATAEDQAEPALELTGRFLLVALPEAAR